MQPNNEFADRPPQFWAYVRLISEQLGYSKNKSLIKYDITKARERLNKKDLNIENGLLVDAVNYLNYRSDILNNYVQNLFMNTKEARAAFYQFHKLHKKQKLTCSLPFNKQTKEKKDFAYFTCIINILAEVTLRKYAQDNKIVYGSDGDIFFDDNPRNLTYFKDNNNNLIGLFSRRFDGAYPSTVNPLAIWEIKEYYYTTTFGSRISDGVYENLLDGYEEREIERQATINLTHIFFIDDYNTWWTMGKSYLCRIIDMLHMGLVDEVIFGKEVFERWPELLKEILAEQ